MKIIILSIFFICQITCSQVTQIVPISSTSADYSATGTYFKDIENSFNAFEGTWIAFDGNTEYKLIILKKEQQLESYPSGDYEYQDWLVGKLFVSNPTNGFQFYSSINGDVFDNYPIKSIGSVRSNAINMFFIDRNSLCAYEFKFRLKKVANQPNQLKYSNFSNEGFYNYSPNDSLPCPDSPPPSYVPQNELLFIKQP